MKKLLIFAMIILGTVSFARGGSSGDEKDFSLRDYEYNEKRDIVEPMEENIERMSRLSPLELEIENAKRDENIEKYPEFHRDLERSDMGEDSQR